MRSSPREDDDRPGYVRLGDTLLSRTEDAVYAGIAALLAVSAVALLVSAAAGLADLADSSTSEIVLTVLDRLLLVFIVVELLYAVRTTLTERQIVAEPFLVAGILTAIKEIIVLSVKAPEEYLEKGPEFARAMVQIGLLGGLVLVLTGAAVLLRRKEREPEEGSGERDRPDDD